MRSERDEREIRTAGQPNKGLVGCFVREQARDREARSGFFGGGERGAERSEARSSNLPRPTPASSGRPSGSSYPPGYGSSAVIIAIAILNRHSILVQLVL